MPTNVINVRGLDEDDVKILEKLADRLRATKKPKAAKAEEAKPSNGFEKSAGSWKGLVDGEELIRGIYADRLVSTRPEVKL